MNSEKRNSLLNLCTSFSDIFHLPNDHLSCKETIKHEIPTISNVPIRSKIYRFPKIHENEVKTQVTIMLDQGINFAIFGTYLGSPQESRRFWRQTKWRLVTDYRKLNEATLGDAYSLPHIKDILDQLGQAKHFSTLDLASRFHQISMNKYDNQKTSFSMPRGHYEFNGMPFGLKNATFQRLMNVVLSGLTGVEAFVYLDDIVVYGRSLQTHNMNLKHVFERLRSHNLKPAR